MKNLLNKKIYAFIIIIILFISTAQAQIIYTDVIPDSTESCGLTQTTCGHHYILDLNNDGINDFDFGVNSALPRICGPAGFARNSSVNVLPLNLNSVLPSKLALNEIIGSNSLWDSTVQILRRIHWSFVLDIPCRNYASYTGDWDTTSDGYLPLRIQINNEIHYGWIRLGVSVFISASFTVKDYAYNSIPDQPIFAGEGGVGGPLPLTFLSFDGVIKNNNVQLTWSTANEINNKGFDIERSTDGQHFSTIGFVKGKGNTASVSQYSFTDATLKSAANFYRLKQIDYDGNFSYSDVIQIKCKNTNAYQLAIAPNPFSNSTTISFILPQSQKLFIRIYDISGRLVKTLVSAETQAGIHRLIWDASNEKGNIVVPGIYYLKINAGAFSQTQKLIRIK